MLDEAARSCLDQVQHILEAVGTTVVWVRNLADAGLRREFQEKPQAVTRLRRRAALERAQILAIHCEDEIEIVKVARVHDPRAQRREIVTSPRGSLTRPPIRQLAHVVARRAGGIDFQHEVRRLAGSDSAKHDLRGRRAADIPETDEENPHSATILRCSPARTGRR